MAGVFPPGCRGDHWSPVFRFLRGSNRQSKPAFAGDRWSPLRDLQKGGRMDAVGAATDFRGSADNAGRLRSTGVGATIGRPFFVSSVAAIVKAKPRLRATGGRPYGICKKGDAWTLSGRRELGCLRGHASSLPPVCVARRRDCRLLSCLVPLFFCPSTIPPSPLATAPFTQGSLSFFVPRFFSLLTSSFPTSFTGCPISAMRRSRGFRFPIGEEPDFPAPLCHIVAPQLSPRLYPRCPPGDTAHQIKTKKFVFTVLTNPPRRV